VTTVAVYRFPHSRRSTFCATAMASGIRTTGDQVHERVMTQYPGKPDTDIAVFYGFNKPLMDDYRNAGRKFIYVDLGYWAREGQLGHHKLGINSRHPTEYFQRRAHASDRFRRLNVTIQPWRKSSPDAPILLCGMSAKGALAEGFHPEEWERKAVAEMRKHTTRRIIYRPKPNWHASKPIDGADYQKGDSQGRDVPAALRNVHAVVTHHSNVALDALIAGVPVFVMDGICLPLALSDLSKIDTPIYPDGREQWAYDAAYTQWTVAEMTSGAPWRHLKSEELVP
jgi:hypothetical protein